MKPLYYLIYCTLSTILISCGTSENPSINTNKEEIKHVSQEEAPQKSINYPKIDSLYELGDAISTASIVQGNANFAIDLFKNIQQPKANLIYSPYSISNAFAMLYGGAKKETADQIQKVLYFPGGNTKLFHQAFGKLNDLVMEAKEGITLRSANKLWLKNGFSPKDGFIEMTRAFYQSDLGFFENAEEGSQKINDWVSQQTNEKIQNIISPKALDRADLVLGNAIYFYGNWQNEFDPDETRPDTFFSIPKPVTTDFMSSEIQAGILQLDQFDLIVLDYKYATTSMMILLPNEDIPLEKVIPQLTGEMYLNWCAEINSTRSNIYLNIPKWNIAPPAIPLLNHLVDMGLDLPFNKGNSAPNFNNIAPDLYVSSVLHKAMIEVNEKGAEAAAATTAVVGSRGVSRPSYVSINRPFLYFIKDNATESILFMGQVVDPSKEE